MFVSRYTLARLYMRGLVIAPVVDYAGRKHFLPGVMDGCNYLWGRQLCRLFRD